MKKVSLIVLLVSASIATVLLVQKPPTVDELKPEVAKTLPTHIDKTASDTRVAISTSEEGIAQAESNVEKVKNACTWRTDYRLNASGTTTPIMTCERSETGQDNPYDGYTNQELADLAYQDAGAAETLGTRLRYDDEQAAMSSFLRAAALSGSGNPLLNYQDTYPSPMFRDDEPVLRGIRARYILSAVSEIVDGEDGYSDAFRQIINEHFEDPASELARLDRRVEEFLQEIRTIQLETRGESTIGIAGDS